MNPFGPSSSRSTSISGGVMYHEVVGIYRKCIESNHAEMKHSGTCCFTTDIRLRILKTRKKREGARTAN